MSNRIVCALLLLFGVFVGGPRVAPKQHVLEAAEAQCTCWGTIDGYDHAGNYVGQLNNSHQTIVQGDNGTEIYFKCRDLCTSWLTDWNSQACAVHDFGRTVRWGSFLALERGDIGPTSSDCP